jgi:membrane protein DedA with SNARE-associated domain
MEEFLANNIDAYGPWAVFLLLMLSGVGVPLGEDVIVIPAGAMVEAGELGYWPVLAATYFGVVGSDLLWFVVCSRYGTRLLHKRGFKRLVHPRRLLEAKHQMEERGAWMLVMARFVPGSRTTMITVAGILHMPFWKFALVTVTCVLITAPAQIWVGRLGARFVGVEDTADLVQTIAGFIVLMLVVMIAARIVRRHLKSHRRAPRAKARWLRRFRIPRPKRRRPDDLLG